jgi:hypothetical protein
MYDESIATYCLPSRQIAARLPYPPVPLFSLVAFLHVPYALRFAPTVLVSSTIPMADLSHHSVLLAFLSYFLGFLLTGLVFGDFIGRPKPQGPREGTNDAMIHGVGESSLLAPTLASWDTSAPWNNKYTITVP